MKTIVHQMLQEGEWRWGEEAGGLQKKYFVEAKT